MKNRLAPLAVLLLITLLSGCNSGSGTNETATTPMSPGQEIFLNNCLGCHMGEGDPPGPNSVIRNSTKLTSLEAFTTYIRNPDNGQMPAFGPGQLSDDDLAKLHSYFKSLK